MGGYCDKCGKYSQALSELRDGTEIYRCYECGRIWGERLVVFDVSFALTEHKEEECQPRSESIEVELATSVIPRNGSSNVTDGGNSEL
jgi:uncharacterized Zn finger protein